MGLELGLEVGLGLGLLVGFVDVQLARRVAQRQLLAITV